MRHSSYWQIKDGQLEPDYTTDGFGYRSREQAEASARELPMQHTIRKLVTIENDLAFDDPDRDPAQDYESARWFVIVPFDPDMDSHALDKPA